MIAPLDLMFGGHTMTNHTAGPRDTMFTLAAVTRATGLQSLLAVLFLLMPITLAGCRDESSGGAAPPTSAIDASEGTPTASGLATPLLASAEPTTPTAPRNVGLTLEAEPDKGVAPLSISFRLIISAQARVPCENYRIEFGDGTLSVLSIPCGRVVGTAPPGGTPTATSIFGTVPPAGASVVPLTTPPPPQTHTLSDSHIYDRPGVYTARFTLRSYSQIAGVSNEVTIIVR